MYLKIIDPDGGKTYDELFQDFTSKYQAMAMQLAGIFK
jgi:hypothetical protein